MGTLFSSRVPLWHRGPEAMRARPLTQHDFDRHCCLEKSNRFSTSLPWLFARYRARTRSTASRVVWIAGKYPVPTTAELKEVVSHASTGMARYKLHAEFEGISKRLRSFGADLKTTYMNINNERRKLLARLSSPEMECPTWFLTLSSSDLFCRSYGKPQTQI